jgi:Beta-xylosidase
MNRIIQAAIFLTILFNISAAFAQKNYNPIVPDNLADPTIMQFGDTFYLYSTSDVGDLKTDLSFSGNPVVWKSNDLVNWSFEGICFPGIDWHKYKYWAPGRVIEKNGKYYLFVTIEHVTQLAVADSPEGPFHFANGPENYTGKERNSMIIDDIDGCPFIDDDGQAYLFWRRKKASRLSADFQKLEGETVIIPTKWDGYSEGPQMFKRNGIYYYLYTMGGYADYQYGYVMSKTSPLGPFEIPKNDVFISSNLQEKIWGPGHGFAFNLKNTDNWYFVYLEYGIGGTSRQIYVNKMEFNPDGTIKTMIPDKKGVGALANIKVRKPIDLSNAKITASSSREPLEVQARKWGNPKELCFNLPEPLPTRIHTFAPKNAADNSNFTEWWATPNDAEKWWQIDFGRAKKIDRCEVFFAHPTLGHAFVLEKSSDGKTWETILNEKNRVIRSPHSTDGIGKTRYIRVQINEGTPAIWEVRFYK